MAKYGRAKTEPTRYAVCLLPHGHAASHAAPCTFLRAPAPPACTLHLAISGDAPHSGKGRMKKLQISFIAPLAFATACVSAVATYALANALAASIEATYKPSEQVERARRDVLDDLLLKHRQTYQAARVSCRSVPHDERAACLSEARSALSRARAEAQLGYACDVRTSMNVAPATAPGVVSRLTLPRDKALVETSLPTPRSFRLARPTHPPQIAGGPTHFTDTPICADPTIPASVTTNATASTHDRSRAPEAITPNTTPLT